MKVSGFIIIFIFFVIISSCDNSLYQYPQPVSGTWYREVNNYYLPDSSVDTLYYTERLEYNFAGESEMIISRKVFQPGSFIFLGYRLIAEGNYKVSGNQLTMTIEKKAFNDDTKGYYSEILAPFKVANQSETVTYFVYEDSLVFKYKPCGPAENCIYDRVAFKKQL